MERQSLSLKGFSLLAFKASRSRWRQAIKMIQFLTRIEWERLDTYMFIYLYICGSALACSQTGVSTQKLHPYIGTKQDVFHGAGKARIISGRVCRQECVHLVHLIRWRWCVSGFQTACLHSATALIHGRNWFSLCSAFSGVSRQVNSSPE